MKENFCIFPYPQIKELKLEDPWAKRCAPQNYIEEKDPMGRRCGLAPPKNMQEVLKKAAEAAKEFISKKHVSLEKFYVFKKRWNGGGFDCT